MVKKEPAAEAARLRAEIDRHNRLYYVDAAPEINDRDYDALLKQLEAIEVAHPELVSPDSPTQRVGGQPIEGFATVRHTVPMLSIDNTYSFGEIREWDTRLRKSLNADDVIRYVVELKVDGVAVSLRYEDGKFVQGSTRGDGDSGDDITVNLRTVRGIPLNLAHDPPPLIELRGEVYMTNAELVRLNELRAAEEEPLLMNPRNATAGTLKLLDPRLCAKRRLKFLAHGLGEVKGLKLATYSETLAEIKRWGVPTTPDAKVFTTIDDVISHAEYWESRRKTLDFQIDGLVIKVDDLEQRKRLGNRSKSPRWVIAFKYEPEEAITKVVNISVQVGKTGKVTPVADLVPVLLSGTTVKRATLHNSDEIARKDIRIGDMVAIQKAGEIIPQVVRVLTDQRTGAEKVFEFPTICPSCGFPVARAPDEADFRCTNFSFGCPDRLKETLRWFAHRDAMDIENLGEKLIDKLVELKLVKGPADLYRLDEATLSEMDRMGKKSASNLVAAITSSKTRTLDRLLTGLTIRHVGTRVSEILAERLVTLDAIRSASLETLGNVPEIGPVVAASVFDFFHDPGNIQAIDDLIAVGVDPAPRVRVAAAGGSLPLAGKTFVITGTLPTRTRTEAEALIKKSGGKVSGSVSKSTSFVLAGEEAGSKLEKARTLGIAVIDEQELERMTASS